MQSITRIGLIATKLKCFADKKPKIMLKIKEKWDKIVDNEHNTYLSPGKYIFNTRTLVVNTSIPPIYIMHLQNQIKERIRSIVGLDYISLIRFAFIHD